ASLDIFSATFAHASFSSATAAEIAAEAHGRHTPRRTDLRLGTTCSQASKISFAFTSSSLPSRARWRGAERFHRGRGASPSPRPRQRDRRPSNRSSWFRRAWDGSSGHCRQRSGRRAQRRMSRSFLFPPSPLGGGGAGPRHEPLAEADDERLGAVGLTLKVDEVALASAVPAGVLSGEMAALALHDFFPPRRPEERARRAAHIATVIWLGFVFRSACQDLRQSRHQLPRLLRPQSEHFIVRLGLPRAWTEPSAATPDRIVAAPNCLPAHRWRPSPSSSAPCAVARSPPSASPAPPPAGPARCGPDSTAP